jgi:hypothetical protein
VTARGTAAAALVAIVFACAGGRAARAQERFVDDEAVQARWRARAEVGYGIGRLGYAGPADTTLSLFGSGLNAEAALGLGAGFEVGVRFGLRLDDGGRGLRADELPRAYEAPTFGTGLGTLANPELRLRWRIMRWRWLEVGLEERFVTPIGADPDVTEIIGIWMAAHAPGRARADVGFDGVLSWQKLATGYVLMPAFGIPVRLWFNLTRGLFAGVVGTARAFAATTYTTSSTQITTGLVGGYRFGPCDAVGGVYLVDIVGDGAGRSGLGLSASCRFGRPGVKDRTASP